MQPSPFLFLDKHFLPADQPLIMADNRAFRYGDGCFETMKWYQGQLCQADAHWERLFGSLAQLGFAPGPHFTPGFLARTIAQLVQKNKHEKGARIRLMVFRGEGGLYDPVGDQPRLLVQSWPLPLGHDQLNSNGLDTGLYALAQKPMDFLSNLKTNQFLPYVLAAKWARQHHWNDAFLCNVQGGIADSTLANVFLVHKGQLRTPALSEGPVAGTMRQQIIRLARAKGIEVKETRVLPEDLLEADELFLTNAIHPIRWVKSFQAKAYAFDWVKSFYQEWRHSTH